MNFHMKRFSKISLAIMATLLFAFGAFAQDVKKMPLATGNNLYCAGYIQKSSINTSLEVVGADDEKDQYVYAEGDELYISGGSSAGVKVGDKFSVIRPRGKFKSRFSRKKNLGTYVEEVGIVEVIRVRGNVSVARVKKSCAVILFGDLLKRAQKRVSPMFEQRPKLDRYRTPSGKPSGRIVLARDGVEMVGRDQIVYIDLGREDNAKAGDYLTVYRPLGTGNIYSYVHPEEFINTDDGNESDRYRGGEFSNKTARPKGKNAGGKSVTTEDAKSRRPQGLRKVVGELVILNVMERTATALVVRNASEIHTGDRVEIQ